MKKAYVRVARFVVFAAILAVLLFVSGRLKAQFAHICVTFQTDDFECPGCCTPAGNFQNEVVVESASTGIESIDNVAWACGITVSEQRNWIDMHRRRGLEKGTGW